MSIVSEIQREMKRRIMFPSATRWSETEMDVAETLRDLYRISLLSSVPFSWIYKRKRSSIQNNSSPFPNKRLCIFNGLLLKGGTSNPTTTLSLPTTESDQKAKHAKNNISLIKKQELLVQNIEDMKKSQASLNGLNREEIENVKKQFDYDQLKNLEIRKQEFNYPNLKIGEKVQLDDQVNCLINNSKSTVENEEQKKEQNQAQQIQMQMLPNHQNQSNGPSSIGLGHNINSNNNGPIALPDLNLLIGEITTNRVIATTQARRRRLQIIRVKKNRK